MHRASLGFGQLFDDADETDNADTTAAAHVSISSQECPPTDQHPVAAQDGSFQGTVAGVGAGHDVALVSPARGGLWECSFCCAEVGRSEVEHAYTGTVCMEELRGSRSSSGSSSGSSGNDAAGCSRDGIGGSGAVRAAADGALLGQKRPHVQQGLPSCCNAGVKLAQPLKQQHVQQQQQQQQQLLHVDGAAWSGLLALPPDEFRSLSTKQKEQVLAGLAGTACLACVYWQPPQDVLGSAGGQCSVAALRRL